MSDRAGSDRAGSDRAFVDVRETHSGAVVMLDELAYKLKKPVDLGFLDFRSPTQRWADCRREVELNTRLAPDVYLGVGELAAPGRPSEPMVVMRRLPDTASLSALVDRALVTDELLHQIARRIAVFHASARRGPGISAEGTRDAISSRWEDSFRQCRPLRSRVLGDEVVDDIETMVRTFLAGRDPLFTSRIEQGRVLDGHGDLTADDIFCLADGPRILDCLEFDDRLRFVDQLDDIAFLAMDLEHLGAPRQASVLLAAYLEYAGDPAPPALLHHFLAYRAFVRAKVVGLRSTQEGADQTSGIQARRFADQARRHLRAGSVQLVLVGGPPGSGKTTLSGHIADRLGMTVLSSDRLRKELAGLAPDEHAASAFGEGLYTDAWSDRTYAELLHRAGVLLGLGESVVLDASWVSSSRRAAAASLAESTGSRLVGIRCRLDARIADARIRGRVGASDADPAVARQVRGCEDPWPEAVEVDTTRDPVDCAERACSLIRPGPASASTPAPRARRPAMTPD